MTQNRTLMFPRRADIFRSGCERTTFGKIILVGLFVLAIITSGPLGFAVDISAARSRSEAGITKSSSTAATDLRELMVRVQSKLYHGKSTATALKDELKEFDSLLAKYGGQKTDDVAEILCAEARLYVQVLEDPVSSRQLILRLKREFPLTAQGRNADQILNSITRYEDAARIRDFLVVGSQFPDFSEKDTARHPLSVSAFKGNIVLVHFWASWSKASVAELPTLLDLYDRYHERGFNIIGVSLDDDRTRLSGFTAQNRMLWPQFCDAARWKNKLAVKYGADTIPTSYLLDRDGKIICKNLSGRALADQVGAALDKK